MIKFSAPPTPAARVAPSSPTSAPPPPPQPSPVNSEQNTPATQKPEETPKYETIYQDYLNSMNGKSSDRSSTSDSSDSDSSSNPDVNKDVCQKKNHKKHQTLPTSPAKDKVRHDKKKKDKISKNVRAREESSQSGPKNCPNCDKSSLKKTTKTASQPISSSKQKKMLASFSKNLKSMIEKLDKSLE